MSQFRCTDNTTKRIVNVQFRVEQDECPDLSFIGEYSSEPRADDVTVDRKERNDMGRGEFRYFIAAMSGEQTGNPESVEQDYQRMEEYNRGGWYMTFAFAEADISINGVTQTIRSGGLGGVESDSGTYFDEIKAEQYNELKDILAGLGFTQEQIDEAFADE